MDLCRARHIRAALLIFGFCLSFGMTAAAPVKADDAYNYRPEGGYVAKPEIAISIAEIVLKSIYGTKTINGEKPLTAKLNADGVWIVQGTFNHSPGHYKGGVAEIWISKSDGRILRVTHGE